MTPDIRPILADWQYRPNEVTVRSLKGEDGKERIQLRLDLGLLQMEIDGRPDGARVLGRDSWLDVHRHRQAEHDAANPDGAPYQLESPDCAELMREAVQYYHRYMSLWRLQRYELCARDTERHLRIVRFVHGHARYDRDRVQFDQWRPYVTMMHARAVATPIVGLKQWDAALGAVEAGIRSVERFLADYGREEEADRVGELVFLRRWRKEILSGAGRSEAVDNPREADDDPVAGLQRQLAEAIDHERFEEAAQLRNQLERLEDPPPPGALGGETP